jgi:hypothetical protein
MMLERLGIELLQLACAVVFGIWIQCLLTIGQQMEVTKAVLQQVLPATIQQLPLEAIAAFKEGKQPLNFELVIGPPPPPGVTP